MVGDELPLAGRQFTVQLRHLKPALVRGAFPLEFHFQEGQTRVHIRSNPHLVPVDLPPVVGHVELEGGVVEVNRFVAAEPEALNLEDSVILREVAEGREHFGFRHEVLRVPPPKQPHAIHLRKGNRDVTRQDAVELRDQFFHAGCGWDGEEWIWFNPGPGLHPSLRR